MGVAKGAITQRLPRGTALQAEACEFYEAEAIAGGWSVSEEGFPSQNLSLTESTNLVS